VSTIPTGLSAGGRALWTDITEAHPDLDAPQKVTLLEACRSKDRLDKLDELLRGDIDTWATLVVDVNSDGQIYELRMTQALAQANATANLLKQLLAALRLPDAASGKRPQQRGGARGAYSPTPKSGAKVSSLDKARAAKSS
jgi:hemin uptake protein HemP